MDVLEASRITPDMVAEHGLSPDEYDRILKALGRVPLWCLLALTSWYWYGTLLDLFVAVGGVITSSTTGVFGPTLRSDFWSNAGISLFAEFVGLFYLKTIAK